MAVACPFYRDCCLITCCAGATAVQSHGRGSSRRPGAACHQVYAYIVVHRLGLLWTYECDFSRCNINMTLR